jgi:hypothetical protein
MMVMSNFLAIATVTAALRRTLQAALDIDVPGAKVTTVRPDGSHSGVPATGANLYLYQVTPNAALRNFDMPNRSSDGRLVQRPQVALDLHYLLTFYGDDNELKPQRLLGSVVRTLHARPVLTRQMITKTIEDPAFTFLHNSNLADAFETVKFTPAPLSLEELSKLWSVFFQTPYRLSVAYIGTVVLIESDDVPESALPVRGRNLYVVPFRQPVIEQVMSSEGADNPIVADSTLVIRGKKLRGDITQVRINGIEVTPAPGDITEAQIIISLPAGLQTGVSGLQVVHQMLMGTPPVPHKGVESNLIAFVLHPAITDKITISNLKGTGSALRSADLTIKINPTIGKEQRVVLLLNEISSGEAVSYTFVAESRMSDTDTIIIPVSGVKAADYLVRVQVDGAESPLITDTDENSPTYNQYTDPKVKIP